MSKFSAIILAAGEGKRMKSKYSKVLHEISNKALIEYVYDSVKEKVNECVIIVGHKAEDVKKYMGDRAKYALQEQQFGTGHAVMQAEKALSDFEGYTLVLCGDTPLISKETINKCIEYHINNNNFATVITADIDNPTGYGRIIRDVNENVQKIVEQKDANEEEKKVKEVNSGMYCFTTKYLFEALKEIKNNNSQGEYYLTDTLEILINKGYKVGAIKVEDSTEIMGINSRHQLAQAQMVMNKRVNDKQMAAGVTIIDPNSTYISVDAVIGMDTVIYPNTIIEGNCKVGEDCILGPNSKIVDSVLGDRVKVEYSVIEKSNIEKDKLIGPFEYIKNQ